jgi:uncharacterized membrane protein YqaE (UPF0057 family)
MRVQIHENNWYKGEKIMGLLRAIFCIIFPPLAVLDRGCGTILIVTLLTLAGWVPGVIAALLLNYEVMQHRRYA